MPTIEYSDYQPPRFLFNGHLQTIIPSQFRIVRNLVYERIKIKTQDEDFLLLDWSRRGSKRLAIISHGLEGDSERPYMKGMARAFNRAGYDALSWNFRGCGGEINQLPHFYHSGATHDLDTVIRHVLEHHKYQQIVLVGFSLGGNLTLKYVGERGASELPQEIKCAVAISAPLDLNTCTSQIELASNFIYSWRFLNNLKKKIRNKVQVMPDVLDAGPLEKIKTIKQFDEYYTAPMHGFMDASDYYTKCSSLQFLPMVSIPTMIVNAQNDPFLADNCYLNPETMKNPQVFDVSPLEGGHCGFMQKGAQKDDNFWSENITMKFVNSYTEL